MFVHSVDLVKSRVWSDHVCYDHYSACSEIISWQAAGLDHFLCNRYCITSEVANLWQCTSAAYICLFILGGMVDVGTG